MSKSKGWITGAVLMSLLFAGCSRGPRIIPASKLVDIYADMFMADQWVASNYNARRNADTTLFYEPIFEKYGYTFEDYDASVRHYLEKPDEYAKILKSSALKLDAQAKRLKKVDESYKNLVKFEPYKERSMRLQDSILFKDTTLLWRGIDTIFVTHNNLDSLSHGE